MIQRTILSIAILLCCLQSLRSQNRREDIYTDYVLYQKRVVLEKDLRERIIAKTFSMPLDSNSEDRYMSACWAIAQFLFSGPEVAEGFNKLFAGYDSLSYDTKIAMLEAVYSVSPDKYGQQIRDISQKETNPKLFALCAVYLYRQDTSTDNCNTLKIQMVEKFPGYDSLPVLQELQNYLSYHNIYTKGKTPDISALFGHQQAISKKVIYSFQRWDRDYPGMAIVQNADGRFVRDAQGRIQVFQQLARSGPDLPYFITNGSTPQGVFSITGTDVSHTNFIGPTPNLQLLMPFEGSWNQYFQIPEQPGQADSLNQYLSLLPPSWKNYGPAKEAWVAGKAGRSEIIAHGTTIDPEYYKDKPFYPLTPTMGCLCAKELWNPTTGHLLVSEQFNLVSAFLSTPGTQGYLFVINLDDQHTPVTRAEVENLVTRWEKGK